MTLLKEIEDQIIALGENPITKKSEFSEDEEIVALENQLKEIKKRKVEDLENKVEELKKLQAEKKRKKD